MNRIIRTVKLAMLAAALFISCSKDSDSENTPTPTIADGTFQYKVNGNLVTMRGEDINSDEFALFGKQYRGPMANTDRYVFYGQKDSKNRITFGISTDSLAIQTYTLDTSNFRKYQIPTGVTYNGTISQLYLADDNMKITITAYQDGYISGTFTAKLSPDEAMGNIALQGTTVITEGEFKKVKCTY